MDGVVMDMVVSERLFNIWVSLFKACWQYGIKSAFLVGESVIIYTSAEEIRKGVMQCDMD